MVFIGASLVTKFMRARKGIEQAREAFQNLDETIPSSWKEEWLAEEEQAQKQGGSHLATLYEPRLQGEKGCGSLAINMTTLTSFSAGKSLLEVQVALNEKLEKLGRTGQVLYVAAGYIVKVKIVHN